LCQECLVAAQGFGLGGSLIIAIGAQNVFVLRQALIGHHVLPVVLFCSFADATLVTLGAIGLRAIVRGSETALRVIAFGGAAFLFWYGLKALIRAFHPAALEAQGGRGQSLHHALATVAAVTLLNPHVYLDTVILVGGISASYPPALQIWFVLGVIVASFAWFFTLGYCGRMLAPLFRNPRAWQIFDIAIAAIMWMIAARLVMLGLSVGVGL
jgi:L-lysine exporter family protein LysE/ArgO